MTTSSLLRWKELFHNFEKHFQITFGFFNRFPPENFSPVLVNGEYPLQVIEPSKKKVTIVDLLNDSILWAVPKSRRSLERRLKMRFGIPNRHWKMLKPKTDILTCNYCGHEYEKRHLCGNCYSKVKKETEEMQEKIQAALGLSPVDKEVVVLYRGEKDERPPEFWQGKRIVEIDKERPQWFSKNLLQKSTAGTSDCVDVKPTELA